MRAMSEKYSQYYHSDLAELTISPKSLFSRGCDPKKRDYSRKYFGFQKRASCQCHSRVLCSLAWCMSVVILAMKDNTSTRIVTENVGALQTRLQISSSCEKLQSSPADVSRGTLQEFRKTKCNAAGELSLRRREKRQRGNVIIRKNRHSYTWNEKAFFLVQEIKNVQSCKSFFLSCGFRQIWSRQEDFLENNNTPLFSQYSKYIHPRWLWGLNAWWIRADVKIFFYFWGGGGYIF